MILINKLFFRLGGRQFGTLGEFQSITHTKKTGNYREIVMDRCVCVCACVRFLTNTNVKLIIDCIFNILFIYLIYTHPKASEQNNKKTMNGKQFLSELWVKGHFPYLHLFMLKVGLRFVTLELAPH